MKSYKNTKQWIRVFFVIAIISLIGGTWQLQKKLVEEIKISGGSFSEGVIGTPRFINPILAQSQSEKDLTQLIFSSLLKVDSENKIDYLLAEKLEISEDKKNFTVKLKPNIYFQDGIKITADDLIFTIEKIQDPLIKSPLFNQWNGISIEKINNLTVKFSLDQGYADFQKNLDIGILPKHIWKKIPTESFIFNKNNTNPIGSGSYLIKNIDYRESGIPKSYTLVKSPYSKSFIEKITLFFYENEELLAKAFRKGEIDAAYGLSANTNNKDLFNTETSITGQLPRIFGLFYNSKKSDLLKDKNIRSLLDSAIDKEKLIDEVFAGYAYPIDGPLGEVSYDKKTNQIEKSLEKIQSDGWIKNEQGIFEKQFPNKNEKTTLHFGISLPNTEDLLKLGQKIKEQFLNYGIDIEIKPFEESTLKQKIIRLRDYEILLFGYMIERDSDLYAFWHSSQISDPGSNISLYENKKLDKELEKLRIKKEEADLSIIKNEIQKDIPASFIYSPAFTYILPKKIKGEEISSITEKSDRFSDINNWYIKTRHLWKIFIKK